MNKDIITSAIKRATDILIVKNPRGTSLGIFCGVLLQGLISVFKPLLDEMKTMDFSAFTLPYTIALGIIAFNIGSFFKKEYLSPEIEETLRLIRIAKDEGNLTNAQIRLMYINLYRKVLESAELNESTNEKLNELSKKIESNI